MTYFDKIIGHDMVKEHLVSAIRLKKVSQAYIINGERGAGKKMMAEAFAMALQCEDRDNFPCMECISCRQIMSGNHPDIKKLVHDKQTTYSVDEIRRQLNNDIIIKPYKGPFKIYIIDEANKLNTAGQNAILKTLEEPPEYAVIILLTENADMLLQTITSRCIRLDLKPIQRDIIRDYLIDKLCVPDYKADLCADFAAGNVGKAIKYASTEDFDSLREDAIQTLKYIGDMEISEIIEAIKVANKYKLEINDYIDIMITWYRDVLLYKVTKDVNGLVFKNENKYIREMANNVSYNGIERIIDAMDKAKKRLNANVNFDLAMQLMLMTIKENS